MKLIKWVFTLLVFFNVNTINSQNLDDAYDDDLSNIDLWPTTLHPEIQPYNGEYQIFLDRFYWTQTPHMNDNAISMGMEIVSFPFIPDEFNATGTNLYPNSDRILSNKHVLSQFGSLVGLSQVSGLNVFKGIGWKYGDFKIYSKVYNENECSGTGNSMCHGDYGLITECYANAPPGLQQNTDAQCLIPHTVIKHTLYYHCGPDISDDVIDSISWIYDNTRGKMKEYPWKFTDQQGDILLTNTLIDVVFRPTFIETPFPLLWTYDKTSNAGIYESGLDPSGGTVNYYPSSEVKDYSITCASSNPLHTVHLYCAPGTGGDYAVNTNHNGNPATYTSELVHAPPYILLDAPLLNQEGRSYAGYYTEAGQMTGQQNTFTITDPFDLRIINPSEKIIYNPSEVLISCDLTFPCFYQFLTLHGKYPDKKELYDSDDYSPEDWDEVLGFDFEYDKDYPTPINGSFNTECSSKYILDGCTLTIEPYVIIMDAEFVGVPGKANYIYYNPNYTYGNWSHDPNTVTLVAHYGNTPHCKIDDIDSDNENIDVVESSIDKNEDFLSVLNSGKTNPIIKISDDCTTGTEMII